MKKGQAISTVVSITIVVIVLIVIGIIFITSSSEGFGQLGQIFGEVFQAEGVQRGEAVELSTTAYDDFFQSLGGNCQDSCFCLPSPHQTIEEGYRFIAQNDIEGKRSATVLVDDEEVILKQVTQPYNLGIFVIEKSNGSRNLRCILPREVTIRDAGETEGFLWYVEWDSGIEDKIYLESVTYKEEASVLSYKIDANTYCLLTDYQEDYDIGSTPTADFTAPLESITISSLLSETTEVSPDSLQSFVSDNLCGEEII